MGCQRGRALEAVRQQQAAREAAEAKASDLAERLHHIDADQGRLAEVEGALQEPQTLLKVKASFLLQAARHAGSNTCP